MVDFLSPGTKVQIVRKGPVALPGVATDIGGFLGIAQKGPICSPQLLTGVDDFTNIFGQQLTTSFLAEAVRDFFNDGGEVCYVSRAAHFTDPTNFSTLTAVLAGLIASSVAGAATSGAESSGTTAFPAVLSPGATFIGSVNGGGATTVTVNATRAVKTGVAGTFAAPTASHVLQVSVAGVLGGAVQTITFAGTENSLTLYLQTVNAGLIGASAVSASGQFSVQTDQMGTGAGITIGAGSSADVLTALGLATGTATGTGNVANVAATQATELATLFNTTFTGSTTTVPTSGQVVWTSNTTGTSSSVQFTGGTGVASITGFDTNLHSGSAAGAGVNTLHIYAANQGAWGNTLQYFSQQVNSNVATTTATAAGTYTQLTLSSVSRILPGDTISIQATGGLVRGIVQGVTPGTNIVTFATAVTVPTGGFAGTETVVDETFNITIIDTTTGNAAVNGTFTGLRMSPLAGGNYVANAVNARTAGPINVTDLFASASDPRPATNTAGTMLTGGSDGGTVVDADFIGNASANTGVWSFDLVDDVNYVSIPGVTTVATIKGLETYGINRAEIFTIPDMPQGYTPSQMVTFVQSTANLASMWECVYFPWVRQVDIVSGTVISAPVSGHVQGVFSRVATQRNFGKAPAGTPDGQLNNVIDVDYAVAQADYDILYPANINAIQSFKGEGICIFGSRTLDPTGEFQQINVVRVFATLKRTLRTQTRFLNFENNNADLQGEVRKLLTATLRLYRTAGILQGSSDADAFFIICDGTNNGPAVVNSGKLIARVGLAVNRPAEFVEFDLENDTRALDAQLASTAQT